MNESTFIPKRLKGKRRYWWCQCGARNWVDRKTQKDLCYRCGQARTEAELPEEEERRLIMRRDGLRCQLGFLDGVGHCEGNLDIHLIKERSRGGLKIWPNLVTVCQGHHRALHPGMAEALDAYRAGDKEAFRKYEEERQWAIRVPIRVRLLSAYLAGVAMVRTETWEEQERRRRWYQARRDASRKQRVD